MNSKFLNRYNQFFFMDTIKITVVGDGAVGKTCLLVTYTTNRFPEDYVPTVYENYAGMINIDDRTVRLELWDTAGQEDYKKLRPLSYPQTDVFIILFSLVSPTSLENAENMWLPEIKEHCPGIPYILVGVKSSERDEYYLHESENKSKGLSPVTYEEGMAMKTKIGAQDYIECDIFKQYHLKEVFESAIKVVLHYHYETKEEIKQRLKNEKRQQKLLQKEEKKRKKQIEKDKKKQLKITNQTKKNEENNNKKKFHFDFNVKISIRIHYD